MIRPTSMRTVVALLLLFPLIVFGESATDKQMLSELQKLNQRIDQLEKRLEQDFAFLPAFVNPEKKTFGMSLGRSAKGQRITSVIQGSPADKVGVHAGDIITAIDGASVLPMSPDELHTELDKKDAAVFDIEGKESGKRQLKIAKARQAEFAGQGGGLTYAGKNLKLSEVEIGQAAPEIKAKGQNGREISLSSLRGKPVLVNFTATWCGPCKKELPELLKLYKDYHGKGLQIVSVYLDKDRSAVEKHIKENEITWPYAFDGKGWDNAVGKEWGVSAIPTNPIVDKKGIIVEDSVRASDLQASVEKYLK